MANPGPGEPVGMDRADLKRMLRLARKEPIHAAFALGGDGKPIIVLDKRKQPRALEKGIKTQAPDAKNPRFGSVFVDPDDPKLARFVINKAASGMARKLIVALKGTGFSKVHIVLEDGTSLEAAEGEDEGQDQDDEDDRDTEDGPDWDRELAQPSDEDADGEPAEGGEVPLDAISPDLATTPGDAPVSGSVTAPPEAAGTPPDAAALAQALTALVKQMIAVIAQDPTQKAALAELATDAQASLKRGDLAQAEAGIAVLRQMLGSSVSAPGPATTGVPAATASASSPNPAAASAPAAAPAATPSSAAATPAAGNGAAATYIKSRMVWMAARQKVDGDIGKLHDAFMDAFKDHAQANDLGTAFKARVGSVMDQFDEALAHKLDEIAANADPTTHAKLVQDAQTLVQRYQSYLASEPLIATLDSNPFTPLAIEKTMTATLSALGKALR